MEKGIRILENYKIDYNHLRYPWGVSMKLMKKVIRETKNESLKNELKHALFLRRLHYLFLVLTFLGCIIFGYVHYSMNGA